MRTTLGVDAAIAALVAVVILIVSPGLAIVALIAILTVLVCGVSFALDGRRRVRRRQRVRMVNRGR